MGTKLLITNAMAKILRTVFKAATASNQSKAIQNGKGHILESNLEKFGLAELYNKNGQ